MWPFTRTLSERYSKLVKLIKSIDSHFQLTEDKEDSLRLHLPNYKGNQTMDFHIYLLEPFLYISFTTEIEGEKVTCLNNFHQDTDQQDMFNAAMANNLDKVHEVLGKKYMENDEFISKYEKEDSESNPAIIHSWPLLTFAKEHGKMQVGEFQNKETGESFKACIFTNPQDNTRVFVAFSSKLGELSPKEIAAMKDELVVVQYEDGNYSLSKRDDHWENVDLDTKADNDRISRSWPFSEYCRKNSIVKVDVVDKAGTKIYKLTSKSNSIAYAEILTKIKEKSIQDKIVFDWTSYASIITSTSSEYDNPCFSFVRIGLLKEPHDVIHYLVYEDERSKDEWNKLTDQNESHNCGIVQQTIAPSNNEKKNIKKTTSSPRVNSKNRKKEQHNTTLQYIAVFIDVLIALCIGFSVYYSEMIRLEQDRLLFLGTCVFLAIIAWGYPYFDKSVKFDNDGCFEQGCIHPLIGVFSLVFIPLFIHYWLYKGIKICIIYFKYLFSNR